jgi:hypothetical protein
LFEQQQSAQVENLERFAIVILLYEGQYVGEQRLKRLVYEVAVRFGLASVKITN